MKQKILFGAAYSIIEPLGLLHLGGLARDLGFETDYCLVKNQDYSEFHDKVKSEKPNFVGFNVYTGNHLSLYKYLGLLKKEFPKIKTILGGPHSSFFPYEAVKHADYVVMSEGFTGLKQILLGEASGGVIPPAKESFTFPIPDRKKFYSLYPKHGDSPIKSIITMTGCPFRCTYCYNSSNIEDVTSGLSKEVLLKFDKSRLPGRLFAWNIRTVDAVIQEAIELVKNYPTKMIYFQDDVFGMKLKWLEEFAKRWPKEVGIKWHAQMRWEMTVGESGCQRLDLCNSAGCSGLTLAIEAADPVMRAEVLDRTMPQEMIFEGMKNCTDRGFMIRTEQITGLPYGATSTPTKINLGADLQILELNVKLRENTGGPHIAWASTFVPYARTRLGIYSTNYGFYGNPGDENWDIKDTFFEKSVLKFLKSYVGPDLKEKKNLRDLWLSGQDLEQYRNQNAQLRHHFNVFAYLAKGHEFAEKYIKRGEYTFEVLGGMVRDWQKHKISQEDEKKFISNISQYIKTESQKKSVVSLAPYLMSVPYPEELARRFLNYAEKKGYEMEVLSDAVRHHLYDYVVYQVEAPSDKSSSYSIKLPGSAISYEC